MSQAQRLKDSLSAVGVSQKKIADMYDFTAQHINNMVNGRSPITKTFAKALEADFNINNEWLLSGSGEMLTTPTKLDSIEQKVIKTMRLLNEDKKQELYRFGLFLTDTWQRGDARRERDDELKT